MADVTGLDAFVHTASTIANIIIDSSNSVVVTEVYPCFLVKIHIYDGMMHPSNRKSTGCLSQIFVN